MPPVSDDDIDDFSLFKQSVKGVTKLEQDKIVPDKKIQLGEKRRRNKADSPVNSRQVTATFEFSDVYQASLPAQGPMRYCREDVDSHLVKRLRRGDFAPELILDLHGLTKEATKQELAALIYAARKEHADCVSIMHGHGQGILKQALPHYLIQHPQVMAFHQAPLEFGGQAALLVLIEHDETPYRLG